MEDLYLPVDLLNNLVIVDTPGTNAVIKRCGLVKGPCWHVSHIGVTSVRVISGMRSSRTGSSPAPTSSSSSLVC